MLGLKVDTHQKCFFLPFQRELFKKNSQKRSKTPKQKQVQTSGIKYVLLVLNKYHFI